jgi:DNA-binding beta-propeller fold protein YncE
VFATATDSHKLLAIDERTLKVIASAPAGNYPDGIAWDPDRRRVYVSDETGGVETVFNADGRRVATVPLGGEAGNVQYDAGSRRVLVAVQSRNELAVIDPRSERVARRVALPGCKHPHGLLIDAPRRLAFVACDGNEILLTLNLDRVEVTGKATVGRSPDVLAFDRALRRLYVASESGEVAIFTEHPRGLTKLGQAFLAPAAHAVAVDSRTHLVYFPLQFGPKLQIMKPTR